MQIEKKIHELINEYQLGEILLQGYMSQCLLSFLVAVTEGGRVLLASSGKSQVCSILQCTRFFTTQLSNQNVTNAKTDNPGLRKWRKKNHINVETVILQRPWVSIPMSAKYQPCQPDTLGILSLQVNKNFLSTPGSTQGVHMSLTPTFPPVCYLVKWTPLGHPCFNDPGQWTRLREKVVWWPKRYSIRLRLTLEQCSG